MPFLRRTLNEAGRSEYRRRAEQLRASGVEIEIPEECQENSRTLDIALGGPAESTVRETRTGQIVYAVLSRLVASRCVILTEWDLSTDYDAQIVPEAFDDRASVCKLGGQEYARHEVLNPRIESGLSLSRGQMVEGLLLATGLRRVPIEYGGFPVPFELIFRDSLGNEYRADGKLSALRRSHGYSPGLRRGSGLDGSDITQRPTQLPLSEESRPRRREPVAEKANRKERNPGIQ